MVKTPRTRHSKPRRDPVTIELEPDAVTRAAADPTPQETASPMQAATEPGPTPEEQLESREAESRPFGYEFPDESDPARPDERVERPQQDRPAAAVTDGRGRVGAVFPMLAAGVVGAVIALAGGTALQGAGLFGASGTPAIGGIQADIAALKNEVAALRERGPAADNSGLAETVEGLRTDLAALRQTVEAGGDGASSALEARIGEIETRLSGLSQQDGTDTAAVSALGERVAAVEALARQAGEAGTDIGNRLAALEQEVASLVSKIDAQAEQPRIALSIAAAALRSAIERGAPFGSELETFAAIAPSLPQIDALRAHAEKGVPARTAIVAETDAAAKAMIAAASPVPADAGFFQRLLSSAESLVTVRPIGEIEGPGVPETVARMEVAVKEGDLGRALTEYDSLPAGAKAAGSAFAEKLKARLEVEQLSEQLVAAAMKAA